VFGGESKFDSDLSSPSPYLSIVECFVIGSELIFCHLLTLLPGNRSLSITVGQKGNEDSPSDHILGNAFGYDQSVSESHEKIEIVINLSNILKWIDFIWLETICTCTLKVVG
jgi:hypothetical protein